MDSKMLSEIKGRNSRIICFSGSQEIEESDGEVTTVIEYVTEDEGGSSERTRTKRIRSEGEQEICFFI